MTKNIKFFLVIILLSLPFWWGMNVFQENLEDFLYAEQIEKNPPSFFIAQISSYNSNSESSESSKTNIAFKDLQIEAKSALSVKVTGDEEKVLFKKNDTEKMPFASLAKLMTAIVASELYYDKSSEIRISSAAIGQEEDNGSLKLGEVLKVSDLLKIMLIESSNDAAFALSEVIGEKGFVNLMNLKAKEIGLRNTKFFNPTGLDPEDPSKPVNYSTARDLVKLVEYILKEHPEIIEILGKKEYPLRLSNGTLHHILKNKNELLGEIPEIIGGKTGFTDRAGGCLIEILKGKKPGVYLINVILNSPDRFGEMRKLIQAIKD